MRDEGYGDSGDIDGIYYHVGTTDSRNRGSEGERGSDVSCESAIGFAFSNCLYSRCGVTIQLSVTGQGQGATASITGGDLWRTSKAEGNTCRIPRTGDGGGGGECLRQDCTPDDINYPFCCYRSPIVIDLAGNGFDLTNAANGVMFDFDGDGVRHQMSWTAANTDDAWLALDRNNNGLVDDATELFGNITNQPAPPQGEQKNGFLALAVFDKTQSGGNGDNQIDSRDNVFAALKLWRDVNHNGTSEASELQQLSQSAIRVIELNYHESRRTDEHGNRFKYRAKVRDAHGAQVGRWAWDVYLQFAP